MTRDKPKATPIETKRLIYCLSSTNLCFRFRCLLMLLIIVRWLPYSLPVIRGECAKFLHSLVIWLFKPWHSSHSKERLATLLATRRSRGSLYLLWSKVFNRPLSLPISLAIPSYQSSHSFTGPDNPTLLFDLLCWHSD